jgi:uncharacterized membrane protein
MEKNLVIRLLHKPGHFVRRDMAVALVWLAGPRQGQAGLRSVDEELEGEIRQGEKDPHFYGQDGGLCLIFEPVTFEELFSSAFDMLRHCSCDNASVLQHMLEVIDAISHEAGSPTVKNSTKTRQELLRRVSWIQAESQAGEMIEQDRRLIHAMVSVKH